MNEADMISYLAIFIAMTLIPFAFLIPLYIFGRLLR